jgi:hypothetical protein
MVSTQFAICRQHAGRPQPAPLRITAGSSNRLTDSMQSSSGFRRVKPNDSTLSIVF